MKITIITGRLTLRRSPKILSICRLTILGLFTLSLILSGCNPPGRFSNPPQVTVPLNTLFPALTATCTSGPPPTPVPSSTPLTTPTLTFTPFPSPTPIQETSTPTTTATPTPFICRETVGKTVTHTLDTNLIPYGLIFRIHLPPCYGQEPERFYPVLYLIHGQSYTEDQWDRLGAGETLDRLVSAGEIAPFLIVMPYDPTGTSPGRDKFGQAVAELLIPWMEANYRLIPGRPYRAIGGLSRGASWAVHLGLTQWELFSAIGGHSLPVFWSDNPYIRQWLGTIPSDSLPRIYLDLGDRDDPKITESATWFEAVLTEMSIPHEWHLFPGYHVEAYWAAHMEQYIRWYAEGFP